MNTPTPNQALQRTPGFGVQLPGAALIRPAQSRAVLPAMKPGTVRAFASRRCALMRAPGPESLSLGSLGDFAHSVKKQVIIFLSLPVMLAGCAGVTSRKPDPLRQPWRDSGAALADARLGKPDASHRAFAAAHAQVMMPYANAGEDAEGIAENLEALLVTVGDEAFAGALLRENPQTRSAVRDCMFETRVREHYPRTHRVLQEAPPVHWPTDVAYERSWAPQAAPPKKGWKP